MDMYKKIRRFHSKILEHVGRRQVNYVGANFIKILKMIS